MLTTGLFTTRVFPIVIQSMREPIRIIPFGDVHYGAKAYDAGPGTSGKMMLHKIAKYNTKNDK